MDIFILELVSNQLTVPVKIDRRQQQEETSALLKSGHQCIHTYDMHMITSAVS